jgi:hypothetical protein
MKKKIKSIAVSAIVILLAVTMASAVTMSVDELKELMSFGNFGALSSETAVNTDADETTNFNDIRADDIEVEDDLFVGGDATITGSLTVTGDLKNSGSVTDASSTMTVNLTLTAAQVCDSNVITVTPGPLAAASLDVILPATSTLFADCLDTEGDQRSLLICNTSATAASTTQIVAGTGIKLTEPDGQNVEIGGGNCAYIDIYRARLSATENAIANVDEWIDAD